MIGLGYDHPTSETLISDYTLWNSKQKYQKRKNLVTHEQFHMTTTPGTGFEKAEFWTHSMKDYSMMVYCQNTMGLIKVAENPKKIKT